MSKTQSNLNDFQNKAETNTDIATTFIDTTRVLELYSKNNDTDETDETVRVKDVMPTFTDWRNHPRNPDNN